MNLRVAAKQALNQAERNFVVQSVVAGTEVAARIEWQPDERVERIVASWPAAWDMSRALGLGFRPDADFDSVIRAYQSER